MVFFSLETCLRERVVKGGYLNAGIAPGAVDAEKLFSLCITCSKAVVIVLYRAVIQVSPGGLDIISLFKAAVKIVVEFFIAPVK